MASDLIYREDAKVFVRHACYKKINPIDYLDEVPAADVRPVVRARWYWDNYRYDWCCSNCSHPADHYIDKDDAYKKPSFKFCPHCSADMREPNLDTTKGDNHD